MVSRVACFISYQDLGTGCYRLLDRIRGRNGQAIPLDDYDYNPDDIEIERMEDEF